ncbi:MAG: DUF2975 domain-containing protein, partial [Kutzneria sp.]|nr:DUF2975 domain-containing protein [Kutzneria sp.]
AGRPFTPDNAVRVRLIGIAVIVGEAGRAVLEWTISLWLRGHFAAAGINLDTVFAPRVEVLLIGVVIMLLAEILRLGTRLQEDHDLTI